MITGKVTSRFQLTLPKEIVEEVGLEEGQAVLYEIDQGRIIITPLVPIKPSKKKGG